jgi:hypothetical protein
MTEDAQDLQCQTARIQENGKTQRARYAADVKKTAVKSQVVAEAFHRNGYYHGK